MNGRRSRSTRSTNRTEFLKTYCLSYAIRQIRPAWDSAT